MGNCVAEDGLAVSNNVLVAAIGGAGDTRELAVVEGATGCAAACIRRSNGAVLRYWALVAMKT